MIRTAAVTLSATALLCLTDAAEPTAANKTTVVAQPEYNPWVPPCYKRLFDVDIPGNDLGSVSAGNVVSCFEQCGSKTGCRAFSWTGYNGGTCWFKSGYGPGTFSPGAITGFVHSLCREMKVVQLANCDIVGNDMSSAPGKNYDACVASCLPKEECMAVTWTDYNGGTCWFKRKFSSCQSKGNAFSAARPEESLSTVFI